MVDLLGKIIRAHSELIDQEIREFHVSTWRKVDFARHGSTSRFCVRFLNPFGVQQLFKRLFGVIQTELVVFVQFIAKIKEGRSSRRSFDERLPECASQYFTTNARDGLSMLTRYSCVLQIRTYHNDGNPPILHELPTIDHIIAIRMIRLVKGRPYAGRSTASYTRTREVLRSHATNPWVHLNEGQKQYLRGSLTSVH
jgi:hypothetical protein